MRIRITLEVEVLDAGALLRHAQQRALAWGYDDSPWTAKDIPTAAFESIVMRAPTEGALAVGLELVEHSEEKVEADLFSEVA